MKAVLIFGKTHLHWELQQPKVIKKLWNCYSKLVRQLIMLLKGRKWEI